MGHLAELINVHGGLMTGLAEALLTGVTPDRFARFSRPGGVEVVSNHPAFVIGHLAIYPERALTGFLGLDAGKAAVPEGYGALFGAGVECVDDPDGSIYPSMDEVVSYFRAGHADLLERIKSVDDDALNAENPNEGFRKRCPTTGQAIAFLMGPHAMMHLGQLSAWRRCEGMGSAM